MNTGFGLEEAVREARERTGVPGVAAGLRRDGETTFAAEGVLALGDAEPVLDDTPFRIASITKPFTATLAGECLPLDEGLCRLLSHSAGLRCESRAPLPSAADGRPTVPTIPDAGLPGGTTRARAGPETIVLPS